MMDDVTVDDFLSGAIKVAQPKSGYRAGIDPILLAASIPAKSGQTVLELGVVWEPHPLRLRIA